MPDSDLLRLLWRPTGELDQEMREYKKVILGAISSQTHTITSHQYSRGNIGNVNNKTTQIFLFTIFYKKQVLKLAQDVAVCKRRL